MVTMTTTRLAINVASALGVSKVIGDIVKNNVVIATTSQKVLVQIGGFVLGSMIVEHAVDHVNKTIDEVIAWRASSAPNVVNTVVLPPDTEVS